MNRVAPSPASAPMGCLAEVLKELEAAGATVIVSGRSVFHNGAIAQNIAALQTAIAVTSSG